MPASTIRVYAFKEGLLSRLAHDLQLTLTSFALEIAQGRIQGRFPLPSLRVDGAVKKGQVQPDTLSEGDKTTIEQTIAEHVLRFERHDEARFEGELGERSTDEVRVQGQLTLAGQTRPVETTVELGNRLRSAVSLTPSHFGIQPYRAMGGALKLRDEVVVELDLDASGLDLEHVEAVSTSWSSKPSDRSDR